MVQKEYSMVQKGSCIIATSGQYRNKTETRFTATAGQQAKEVYWPVG